MTTKSIEQLQSQIEQLVREHLVAHRSAATAAVERAFASVMAATSARASSNARASSRSRGRRRPPAEVAGLTEELYAAVRANPGEVMSVIAASVGKTSLALNRPMQHLKRAGRVRSAGERRFTRYFPMTPST
jgi:hypothetical protein